MNELGEGGLSKAAHRDGFETGRTAPRDWWLVPIALPVVLFIYQIVASPAKLADEDFSLLIGFEIFGILVSSVLVTCVHLTSMGPRKPRKGIAIGALWALSAAAVVSLSAVVSSGSAYPWASIDSNPTYSCTQYLNSSGINYIQNCVKTGVSQSIDFGGLAVNLFWWMSVIGLGLIAVSSSRKTGLLRAVPRLTVASMYVSALIVPLSVAGGSSYVGFPLNECAEVSTACTAVATQGYCCSIYDAGLIFADYLFYVALALLVLFLVLIVVRRASLYGRSTSVPTQPSAPSVGLDLRRRGLGASVALPLA